MEKGKEILPVNKLALEDVAKADLKAAADRLGLDYDEGHGSTIAEFGYGLKIFPAIISEEYR